MKVLSNKSSDILFLSDEEKIFLVTEASESTSSGLINNRNIIFIDTRVPDYESLIANGQPDTEVVILDPTKDGITQITESLLGKQYDSLHIVSHGSAGSLQLGSNYLNSGNLSQYESQLKQWKASLTEEADILLYGCDVAAGETGVGFVQQLSQMTGADVAASNDLTGNAALGGDWDLEVKTGNVEAGLAFKTQVLESYNSALNNDLFFSEYIEGSSNNKALEIYNGTGGTVNLATGQYVIQFYNNGVSSATRTINLTSSIADGDVFVLANSSANAAILSQSDQQATNSSWYNGNDAIVLRKGGANGTIIDVIGQVGVDPISEWGSGLVSTADNTLRRKKSITAGDTNPSDMFDPSVEWDGFAVDTFQDLGRYNAPVINSAFLPTLTEINEDSLNNGGTYVFDLAKNITINPNNDPQGIAVTNLDNSNGIWQYSLNGGENWSSFSGVSETSATILSAGLTLYNGSLGRLPNSQRWLQFGTTPINGGTQTVSNGVTNVITTGSNPTGYSNHNQLAPTLFNPSFPSLDRNIGFTVSFEVKINSESHSSDDNDDGIEDRAGFSVIVVTSDNKKAIELGFWTDEIWAQNDGPNAAIGGAGRTLFTHSNTERAFGSTTQMTRYNLMVQGDTYKLFTGNSQILTGNLRDYTAFDHSGASLPYDPYERTNFLFLGDNTSSGQSNFDLKQVDVWSNNKVRFLPKADYNGTANIKFRAWDGSDGKVSGTTGVNASLNGGTTAYSSNDKTAILTINPVNDAPTFSIGGNQSVKMGAGQQTVAGWVYDFNAGVNESSQTALDYVVDVTNNPDVFSVAPTIDAAGKLTYTPIASLPGSGVRSATATIAVKAKDSEGGISLEAKNFKITVTSGAINFVTTDPTNNNILVPTTNDNNLMGTDGSDRIDGLAGNDTISGGLGNDRIIGGAGNDILYGDLDLAIMPSYASANGFTFDDIIQGNAGNDTIYGGWGKDTLYGNDGDDIIWGGDGDDIIWGVAGKDTFVLNAANSGKDTIQDFTLGEDKFGCAGGLGYASLTFTQQGNDTLIQSGGLDLALVKNMTKVILDKNTNFISI